MTKSELEEVKRDMEKYNAVEYSDNIRAPIFGNIVWQLIDQIEILEKELSECEAQWARLSERAMEK